MQKLVKIFNINVNYARLGLKRAIVFAEAVPGYEDILFDASVHIVTACFILYFISIIAEEYR